MDRPIFILRESRGGRPAVGGILQGSRYEADPFALDASDLRPPRLLRK